MGSAVQVINEVKLEIKSEQFIYLPRASSVLKVMQHDHGAVVAMCLLRLGENQVRRKIVMVGNNVPIDNYDVQWSAYRGTIISASRVAFHVFDLGEDTGG